VFKNRVLRRQFGPEEEEVTGNWRKLHNEELHSLCSRIIIEVNTSRRMIGEGHVEIWGGGRNIHQVYLITHTNTYTHTYIYCLRSLKFTKFTLKHLKRLLCYVNFGAVAAMLYAVQRCTAYNMAATAPKLTKISNLLNVLNYNFSKEQYMLPEDDRVIETCRSILNVLM